WTPGQGQSTGGAGTISPWSRATSTRRSASITGCWACRWWRPWARCPITGATACCAPAASYG
ncbi:MAG: hypothetical protein AVDCRST_MAG24-1207, partial [uncultured Nocardioidaceae bacterium]